MATFGPYSVQANGDDYMHRSDNVWSTSIGSGGVRVGFSAGGGNREDHCVFRFASVDIPQGSTIDSCTIDLITSDVGFGSGTISTKIAAVDEDNAAAATNDATCDADDAIRTTAKVDWDFTQSDPDGSLKTTPDISAIIQEITDRSGWASGNAIIIQIFDDGSGGDRAQGFVAVEHATLAPAAITIGYTTVDPFFGQPLGWGFLKMGFGWIATRERIQTPAEKKLRLPERLVIPRLVTA